MVIRKVGQLVIDSISDFEAAIRNASLKDGVLMRVKFGDASRFVVVKG